MKKIIYCLARIVALISSFFIAGIVISVLECRKKKAGPGRLKNGAYNTHVPYGYYEKYFKRPLDIALSLLAVFLLWPVLLTVGVCVKVYHGSPVLFVQPRPGLDEKIFLLHKFRTMTDETDDCGRLKPDKERLTHFGKMLRSTSLDELPELFDILAGNLSIAGPRPLLVRDMVFMSDRHRRRHEVTPGLTGLAQVNGRNQLDWERKLDTDLVYCQEITFLGDLKIILKTIKQVLLKHGIHEKGHATAPDYGDWLLEHGLVERDIYDKLQKEAEKWVCGDGTVGSA